MTDTPWIEASRSDDQGGRVEQRRHGGVAEVRDTEDGGTGQVLRFTGTSSRPGSTRPSAASSTHLASGG